MIKLNNSVEYIKWKKDNKMIHTVGFVTGDTTYKIKVALTKSYGEYTDIIEIEKNSLILRKKIQK